MIEKIWSSSSAGSGSHEPDMPDFSFTPQEYITQVNPVQSFSTSSNSFNFANSFWVGWPVPYDFATAPRALHDSGQPIIVKSLIAGFEITPISLW